MAPAAIRPACKAFADQALGDPSREIDDSYHSGKAERESPNKVPFVAARQTAEADQLVYVCLSAVSTAQGKLKTCGRRYLAQAQ